MRVLQAVTPHERARNGSSGSRLQETVMSLRQRLDVVFEDAIFHKRCRSNPAAAIRRKLREAQLKRERGSFRALPYRDAPACMARLRLAVRLVTTDRARAQRQAEDQARIYAEFVRAR